MNTERAPAGLVGALALGLLAACGRPPAPATVAPSPSPPLATKAPDTASVVAVADVGGDRTVHLRLSAPPAYALAVDNCNGAFQWGLERRVAGAWEPAWGAETDACQSAPIFLAAGTSREFALAITGASGDALDAGTYRAVVHGLLAVAPGKVPDPLPEDQRASAPFRLPARAAVDAGPG
jgi:hypothetical protein